MTEERAIALEPRATTEGTYLRNRAWQRGAVTALIGHESAHHRGRRSGCRQHHPPNVRVLADIVSVVVEIGIPAAAG
jgi:hypothetical protein